MPQPEHTVVAARLSAVDSGLADLLSDAERNRAAKMADAGRRERFVAGRILLRLHAGRLTGAAPRALRADYWCPSCGTRGDGAHGAPRYRVAGHPVPVRLSLSRSRDWCLLVGSWDAGVAGLGVDLQDVESAGFEDFPAFALTPAELRLLAGHPIGSTARAQARFWTRKEAVLKALGCGLDTEPADVDVSGPVPVVLGRVPDEVEARRWSLHDLAPTALGLPAEFAAAVAIVRHR